MSDLIRLLLPGDKGVLAVYSLYIDESINTRRIMRASGYLLTAAQGIALVAAWDEALGELPYFHMKEGHSTRHPEIYARLLDLISSDHMLAAFDVSISLADYDEIASLKANGFPIRYWFGGPYSFLVGAIAHRANRWLDTTNPSETDVAYVLDSGSVNEGEAGKHFEAIEREPYLSDLKRKLRYRSHTFQDSKRRGNGPLQAADILAWNLNRAVSEGRIQPIAKPIFDRVQTYQASYGKTDIQRAVEDNIDFCQFIGQMKSGRLIRT